MVGPTPCLGLRSVEAPDLCHSEIFYFSIHGPGLASSHLYFLATPTHILMPFMSVDSSSTFAAPVFFQD